MSWEPEIFETAQYYGPSKVAGYTYRGLGLHMVMEPSPKGRRPARWNLSHLGSGHLVGVLTGDVATAFPVAGEVAEAGDWEFLSLDGWKDRFPDAAEKVREIAARHPKVFSVKFGGGSRSHQVACQIASNRP